MTSPRCQNSDDLDGSGTAKIPALTIIAMVLMRARSRTALALLPFYLGGISMLGDGVPTHADCERSEAAQTFKRKLQTEKAELIRINGAGTNQMLKADLLANGENRPGYQEKNFLIASQSAIRFDGGTAENG
jgi:hypothetical protein